MNPNHPRRLNLALLTVVLALAPTVARAVSINVTYTDGPTEGFFDPVLGNARRTAFQAALANWGGKLAGSVPITVSASMDPLGGTSGYAVLGQAYSNYVTQLSGPGVFSGTWYPAALTCELVGSDVQPGVPMIVAQFNSDVDNSTVLGNMNWYYGTDGISGTNVDFYEVVVHEMGHGLGFFSQIQSNGSYYNAAPNNLPSAYDQFLATGPSLAADRLVILSQAQRAAALIGGSLYFDGSNTVTANGASNARIYAPNPYVTGSSTSHLDQATYQNGVNALMCPQYSISVHEAGPVGYAVLKDIGWPFTTSKPPVATNSSVGIDYNTATVVQMSATDPENDPLSYQVVSKPSHGTLMDGLTAARMYTPAAGYIGQDSFTFKANDGHWDSNAATVTLTVHPPAPVIAGFTPTSGPVGSAVIITGQNFGTLALVYFNGVLAPVQWPTTDTQIICTVPAGATTGPITVAAPGGNTNSASNFTVLEAPAGATTYAQNVTDTGATVHPSNNPMNQPTNVSFEYGPTTAYGSSTASVSIGSGNAPVDAAIAIGSLAPGTTIHYRAVATNGAATVTFGDSYFVTMLPDGGTALQFDGTTSSVALPAFTTATSPTDEVTVEFWQNVSSVKDQFSFITTPDDVSNRMSGAVPWGDGTVYWDFGDLSGTGRLVYIPQADQPLTGHWEHWAFVSSAVGDFMKIYRNGIEVASKTGHGTYVPPLIPSTVLIGSSFGGTIDELRIWRRARTAAEIYHDMYIRLTGSESGLVRLLHFDEGAGVTAVDSSPFALSGTFANTPIWVASTAPIGYPVSITLPATGVGMTSATLNAIVNYNGHYTLSSLNYGTTTAYGTQIDLGTITTPGDTPIAFGVNSLVPSTTYHYRVESSNYFGGSSFGVDQTFTTTSAYSMADALGALQSAAGLYTPTAAEAARWDVVKDDSVGQVTISDATAIARKASGLDPNP